jgi:hypothetical protein
MIVASVVYYFYFLYNPKLNDNKTRAVDYGKSGVNSKVTANEVATQPTSTPRYTTHKTTKKTINSTN